MPVSWQIDRVVRAMSHVGQNNVDAWSLVLGVSPPAAIAIAAHASGGRFVDVWVMSSNKLPARIPSRYLLKSTLTLL